MNLSVLITVFFTTAVVVFSFCAGNKNVAMFYFSLALIGFIAFAAFYWSRIVKNRGAIIVAFCQLICLVIMMSDKNCSSVGLLFCGFFLVNFFIGKSSLQVSVLNLFTTLFLYCLCNVGRCKMWIWIVRSNFVFVLYPNYFYNFNLPEGNADKM